MKIWTMSMILWKKQPTKVEYICNQRKYFSIYSIDMQMYKFSRNYCMFGMQSWKPVQNNWIMNRSKTPKIISYCTCPILIKLLELDFFLGVLLQGDTQIWVNICPYLIMNIYVCNWCMYFLLVSLVWLMICIYIL